MKQKSKLSTVNKILSVILVLVVIATAVVIYKYPVITEQASTDASNTSNEDVSVLETPFTADTYAGIEFKSLEDVAAYYNAAYDKTKAQTREYLDGDGNTCVWYTMLGEENLQVTNIMIEGKSNSMINGLVPTVVGSLYSKGLNGLTPCANRDPNLDVDINNESLKTSRLVADDILDASIKDNNDGTITMIIQPKAVNMSTKGMDAQGHLFSTLGDIASTVESISILEWESGTTQENCKVDYRGGTATVTIDTKTGLITTADYHMEAHIAVSHATIKVIKDKSATLLVTYDVHFPASDKYLMDTKQCKVK